LHKAIARRNSGSALRSAFLLVRFGRVITFLTHEVGNLIMAAVMELESKLLKRHHLPTAVLGCDVPEDQKRIFLACIDGVYQLDLGNGEFDLLYSHTSYASGVVYFSDPGLLVSGGYDGTLQWFDLQAKQVVRSVQAHKFWSWDLARTTEPGLEKTLVATSTGQYLAGNYQYNPKPMDGGSVKVFQGSTGELVAEFQHGPPVQAVALSHDGKYVSAGNLMGDVAVWEVAGEKVASWNTPDFTAFGTIKSHCQIGGVYAIAFTKDGSRILVAGMGPMADPMAGNGKQRWQLFDWQRESPPRISASKDEQVGEGLMETLCLHPSGQYFVMAGRLRGGAWSTGIFDLESGNLLHSIKSGSRVTKAVFSADGNTLYLAGAINQSEDADHKFGVLDVYELEFKEV